MTTCVLGGKQIYTSHKGIGVTIPIKVYLQKYMLDCVYLWAIVFPLLGTEY